MYRVGSQVLLPTCLFSGSWYVAISYWRARDVILVDNKRKHEDDVHRNPDGPTSRRTEGTEREPSGDGDEPRSREVFPERNFSPRWTILSCGTFPPKGDVFVGTLSDYFGSLA